MGGTGPSLTLGSSVSLPLVDTRVSGTTGEGPTSGPVDGTTFTVPGPVLTVSPLGGREQVSNSRLPPGQKRRGPIIMNKVKVMPGYPGHSRTLRLGRHPRLIPSSTTSVVLCTQVCRPRRRRVTHSTSASPPGHPCPTYGPRGVGRPLSSDGSRRPEPGPRCLWTTGIDPGTDTVSPLRRRGFSFYLGQTTAGVLTRPPLLLLSGVWKGRVRSHAGFQPLFSLSFCPDTSL